jgi:hypothetical protein
MTIEIGSQKVGRVGRRGGARSAASLPIGEVDANIFACPACSRPLGAGTPRCPGCGTRLIAGVKASRAATFVGIGVFTGMIASGALMGIGSLVSARPTPADVAVVPAPPVVTPTRAPLASAPAPVVDAGIPSSALSALGQSARINQRLLADAGRLTAALAAPKPSTAEIAPILRTMNTSAAFGAKLAPTVGDWDRAATVSDDLATFYAAIAATAEQGLSASLRSSRAYTNSAEQMLDVVAGLNAIDAASRKLAASADLELPPLTAP